VVTQIELDSNTRKVDKTEQNSDSLNSSYLICHLRQKTQRERENKIGNIELITESMKTQRKLLFVPALEQHWGNKRMEEFEEE